MVLFQERKIVEAIEEGRIVHVSEDYAIREGLIILRKPEISFEIKKTSSSEASITEKKEKKGFLSFEEFRRPLKHKQNNVLASLVDNFHWIIANKRKERNMNRKQLASALNVDERSIKLLEFGILPSDDYILINKVQQFLDVNLRKDGKDFNISMRESVRSPLIEEKEKNVNSMPKPDKKNEIVGSDIEIIE